MRLIKELCAQQPETEWVWQYSPEVFTSTELDFACGSVIRANSQTGKPQMQGIRIGVEVNCQPMLLTGMGNGPIDAAVHALQAVGIQVQVRSYEERSTRASTDAGDAQACAFLERVSAAGGSERFGVGMDSNIVTASVKALLSGVNQLGLAGGVELASQAA